jgi:hypothetical protein
MSYTVESFNQTDITVSYIDTTGANLCFNQYASYSAGNSSTNSTTVATANSSSDNITVTTGDIPYSAFLDALYSAAFLPPNPYQSLSDTWYDGWGNTRIPLFGTVIPSQSIADYSSLYGIPVEYLFYGGAINDASIILNSAYWNFNCSSPIETTWGDVAATGHNLTQSPGLTLNMGMEFDQYPDGSFKLGHLYFASAIISNGTFTISDIDDTDTGPLAYSECTFTQTFVQTTMECSGNITNCQPLSQTLMNPAPKTQIPKAFTDWMTYASADVPSLTERYIYNPDSTAMDTLNPQLGFSLLGISQGNFTQRLAIAVNTFWTIGFAPMFITGNLASSTLYQATKTYNVSLQTATGTAYAYAIVYAYSPGWTALLFICSIILITFGITNIIWESRTIGPNVLGFASSILRNNSHMNARRVSSALSGPEKARQLGNMKVMMQDVRAGDEVGKIALGAVSEGAQRLREGRLYR